MTETIGFTGVGLMGHGMAKNIVEKGYRLVVAGHRNRAPVEDLVARGAEEAAGIRDLAAKCTIVFICVSGSPEVEEVVNGPDGLKSGLKRGSVVVDCSTSNPVSTAAVAESLAGIGVDFADAPLSRTPKDAWEGKLDTMVGATQGVFDRIQPVLKTWAGRIVHVGGVGDGHRMKLLNNFISLGYGALYAEALALAEKVGISPQRFDAVIRGGRMDCGFYQTFMAYALEGNRESHRFSLQNAYKDLRYLEAMADAAAVVNVLGNAVKNTFGVAIAAGGGSDNVPMLVDYVRRLNGEIPAAKEKPAN
jgi:3-hydroxyisobutyrate dehydrogenase-like beta-hydroxyacid dehydrogenase